MWGIFGFFSLVVCIVPPAICWLLLLVFWVGVVLCNSFWVGVVLCLLFRGLCFVGGFRRGGLVSVCFGF